MYDGATLVFSFIGFAEQEVEVGARIVIDVTLASDATELSEVVVTALGITRDKASLGYGCPLFLRRASRGDRKGLAEAPSFVNFLKLRIGYGTSAGYPSPYRTRNTLFTNPSDLITADGTTASGVVISSMYANPDLKPERHTELELGIETRLFSNKLGIDLSLYDKTSEDLIIDLSLDPSTGYDVSTINSAELNNKGIELGLNIGSFSFQNISWNSTINFTKNVSEVVGVATGIDKVLITGLSTLGNFVVPGESYGVHRGIFDNERCRRKSDT